MDNGRATVEKYAQTGEKLYMTVDEAVVLSEELARRLAEQKPRPEVVVGIADGALLIAAIIAERLGVPMVPLRIRRRGTGLKKKLASIPGIRTLAAKLYPVLCVIPIVNIPVKATMQRLERLESGPAKPQLPGVEGKRVALVDDCIESGQTFIAARDLLLRAGATSVSTACISWSRGGAGATSANPDLFINRKIQHYPWSSNSPHWNEYHTLLEKRGIKLGVP